MKKQLLRRISLFLISCFIFTAQAFSSSSKAKATATVDKNAVTVGEAVALSVSISGMTNGSGSNSKNSSCKYTITIPDNLLNADQTEVGEKQIKNELIEVGSEGNKTYEHGSYTSLVPGTYTFNFDVTEGDKNGDNPATSFHPGAPANLELTDITPSGFTATWESGVAAESYTIVLERSRLEPIEISGITASPYTVTGVDADTEYICKIKSVAAGLTSLKASNSVLVKTGIRPVINMDGEIKTFNLTLGDSASVIQKMTVSGQYLHEDISLSIKNGNAAYSLSKNTVSSNDEESTISITFTPDRAGEYNDTLIIKSLYAEDIRIALTGKASLKKPTAKNASNIGGSSFTANWEAVPFAEEYLIYILDDTNSPAGKYNKLPVGNVTNYVVTDLYPESKYTFYVYAVNNNIVSSASNSVTVNTNNGPTIIYQMESAFVAEVNKSMEKTIRIYGLNLTEKISLELAGDEFSIDKNELDSIGGSVLISYYPQTIAEHTATLTLQSASANDVVITLTGHGLPAVTTATAASEITNNSFKANWEVRDNVTDYLLTVKQKDDIIIENYSSNGANSLTIDELTAGKTYTYTVKVVENGLTSPDSDPVTVITHSAPQPVTYPEKTAIKVMWPAVPNVDSYKVFLFKDDIVVEEYNGTSTTQTEFVFSNLDIATNYSYEIISLFGENEYTTGKIDSQTGGFYGAQLRNMEFEAWDNVEEEEIEPEYWNSFMSADGDQTSGIGAGFVKVQKVNVSELIRPNSTGEKSAVIWSTAVIGIVANGNLTTGRIMANSMTPTDLSNHNKTLPDSASFNAPFAGKADSLTVWVRFVPGNMEDSARVSAIIHDNYPYQDPNGQLEIEQHAFAKAECNYAAVSDTAWQRLTIPFKRTGNDVNPAYMLVSFTTNKTPGKGSANDSVYIDDMLMIYKPELSIETANINGYILGETINIPFSLTGTMSPYNLNAEPNVVYLELSDAEGSFKQARRIAQLTTDYSGTLTAQLPDDLEASTQYKLRVVTTNYPMISEPSEPFSIIANLPEAPVAKAATDIKTGSFVANWEAVAGATSYIVTIAEKDYIAEGENTLSLKIDNLTPETNYTYIVKAAIGSLVSLPSSEISVKTEAGGLITSTGATTLTTTNNVYKREVLNIQGIGLVSNISIALADDENGFFSINKNKISMSGGEITLSYRPKTLGVHSATLLLSSPFIDTVKVSITGNGVPQATRTLAANSVTPTSFIAQWEAGADAETYMLTILDTDDEIVNGYDNLNVGDTTAIKITGLLPDTEYSYVITAVSQDMQSEISNKTVVSTLKKPAIQATSNKTEFSQDINVSDETNVTILASDLASDIIITSLTGSKHFSLQVVTDEEFLIDYTPTQAGKDTATLTISTAYADAATIILTGTARPLPVVALPAGSTTLTSFVACWEESENADAYLLTIKNNTGSIVQDYNQKNVGNTTSVEITDLQKLRNYTYYVEVLKNEVVSEISNTINVRTANSSGLNTVDGENISLYPNPAKSYVFIEGIQNETEYAIINVSGILIQKGVTEGKKISLEKLQAGIYILKTEGTSIRFIKE